VAAFLSSLQKLADSHSIHLRALDVKSARCENQIYFLVFLLFLLLFFLLCVIFISVFVFLSSFSFKDSGSLPQASTDGTIELHDCVVE
jgi:hypothetical protein